MFRIPFAGAVCALALSIPTLAAEDPGAPLPLSEAVATALDRQPLIEAQRADIRAARQDAVAAAQLPDPQLVGGITNLPINGPEPFSLSADFMTMTGLGLRQEFPRREKRRLAEMAHLLMADHRAAGLDTLRLRLRRDVTLAWLDRWHPQQAIALVEALRAEARRELDAAGIEFRAGRSSQADMLLAQVQAELLTDRLAAYRQALAGATARLERWIGEAARRPLPDDAPDLPPPPRLEVLQRRLAAHPEWQSAALGAERAENELARAQAAYRADWRVEAGIAWRPDFSEMATLRFGMDLPMFTAQRQDRAAAAARERLQSQVFLQDDAERRLQAEAAGLHDAWSHAMSRLQHFDDVLLPAATARADAELAAYRSGRVELSAVLRARRDALDAALLRLDLHVETLRLRAGLRYLIPEGA